MPHSESQRPGSRRFGFLMLRLAVDDGCHVFHGILANSFPDAHHVPASGIDNLATALLDFFQSDQVRAKRGYDNNIVRSQFVDFGLASVTEEIFDPHGRDLLVNEWIVNNLAENKETRLRKNLPRRIS